ncbi:MAG: molecular chaperone TorD family protein [Magnetococcales bacterium]|nr:molecular chaperone TorD family protein [Magnetococcales bacterium]
MNAVSADVLILLAGLLGQPGPEALAAIEEMAVPHPWLRALAPGLQATSLAEWQAEHTRLFVSGVPKTIAPPFASYWRHGFLGGDCVREIAGLYARAGVVADPGVTPDYLGSLLELAAYLQSRPDAVAVGLLEVLWGEHLAPWVPRFAAALQVGSSMPLYRALAGQLAGLFGEEHATDDQPASAGA